MKTPNLCHYLGSLLLLIISLTGCGTIVMPTWTATFTAESAVKPTSAATPIPNEPSNAQVGRWLWRNFTTEAESYPPVQLWLDVHDGGSVSGTLSIYPNSPDIPQSALTLIQQNGCNVPFGSFDEDGLSGRFISTTEARIHVNVTNCTVKFYGAVDLSESLRGEFVLEYDEAMTLALRNSANTPLTPLERGRKVFTQYCSACHGTYGEGAPAIPSLNTDQVHGYTDDEIMQKITNGVVNTVMPAWGNVLSQEDREGVLELIRNIAILETGE